MKMLIVVDMQNDFIDGALGSTSALKIVDSVSQKIADYRDMKSPVIFTRDTHNAEYLKTQEGEILPIPHCIHNTEGWNISSKLDVQDSLIVDKQSFGSLDLVKAVAEYDMLTEIELIGLCTDICVISNALILKAAFPEVKIMVDASCCAGITPESHKNALKSMKMFQVSVINEEA